MDVTILGSGSPLPDPDRAGPSGLVRAGGAIVLVDCGRGVLMRLAGAGVQVAQLSAVLLTHLHSDHTTDFADVLTTWWVMPMTAGRPLPVVGPPGTRAFVDATIAAMATDVGYRIAHHDDLNEPPACTVTEIDEGIAFEQGGLRVVAALVDHGVVRPAIGFRFEHEGHAAAWSGDTLPLPALDRLCDGAACYVQTVVRRDLVEKVPVPRFLDILDYHSDLAGAAKTAAAARVRTLVLNHMVPGPAAGTEDEWIAAVHAAGFDGAVVVAHDLLTIEI